MTTADEDYCCAVLTRAAARPETSQKLCDPAFVVQRLYGDM